MKRIVIVTGPPCSGKTTYVRSNMGKNDVVFDFDEIKAAVCLCNPHDNKPHARELINNIRHYFIEYVIHDNGNEIDTVFYIECQANSQWLNRLRRATQAYIQVVNCEASLEECLDRLENDDSRPDKASQRSIIMSYFPAGR